MTTFFKNDAHYRTIVLEKVITAVLDREGIKESIMVETIIVCLSRENHWVFFVCLDHRFYLFIYYFF